MQGYAAYWAELPSSDHAHGTAVNLLELLQAVLSPPCPPPAPPPDLSCGVRDTGQAQAGGVEEEGEDVDGDWARELFASRDGVAVLVKALKALPPLDEIIIDERPSRWV